MGNIKVSYFKKNDCIWVKLREQMAVNVQFHLTPPTNLATVLEIIFKNADEVVFQGSLK